MYESYEKSILPFWYTFNSSVFEVSEFKEPCLTFSFSIFLTNFYHPHMHL